jgi:hypothetical protein
LASNLTEWRLPRQKFGARLSMTQTRKNSQNENESLTAQEALLQHFKVVGESKVLNPKKEKEEDNG